MRKMYKVTAALVFSFIIAAGIHCTDEEPVLYVQAQEKEELQRTIKETEALKFLTYCDQEKLKSITVTESQAAEMMKVVNDLTASEKSDYTKAKNIFVWMKNITYESNPYAPISAEAYEVFKSRQGVCGGFSNLYNELLHLAGIPSVAVTGTYGSQAHQWNAVYADGKWFYVDTTGAKSGVGFDSENDWDIYKVTEVFDAILEKGNLLIGYYHGTAVVGTKQLIKTITIPDAYEDMMITSISYQLFDAKYGMEVLNIGSNVTRMEETERSMISSKILKQVNVSEENTVYASREGILFTKDMKALLVYPMACDAKSFTLPKETITLDMKDAFGNINLTTINVEEGNTAYASYDGALYDADMKQLLFVPAGKTTIKIPAEAVISDMAFANSDRKNMTIYGTPGSYAEKFAGCYNIKFVNISEWEEPPAKVEGVVRLAGEGRIQTGLAIAGRLKETLKKDKFDTVIIARHKFVNQKGKDTGFADALSGSYLAVQEKAPILLISDNRMPDVIEYVNDNLKADGKVFILGGNDAVSETVEEKLAAYDVTRLGGDDRYETNMKILEEAKVAEKGGELIVATGKNFADSLSASASKLPILTVNGEGTLEKYQVEFLEEMKPSRIYVVGGSSAVNTEIEDDLELHCAEVVRLAGGGRRETSVMVAGTFAPDATVAVTAIASDYPDGLCGGPLAAALNAPLILTGNEENGEIKYKEALEYMESKGIEAGYVLGGDTVLTNETVAKVFGLESAEEIK